MLRRSIVLSLTLLLGSLFPLTKAAAQDEQNPPLDEQMMAAMQPGPHHEHLAQLLGDWDASLKMWMGPGEPVTSTGQTHYEWALGGRYLMGSYHSVFMGQPFEGRSIDAYDNLKGEYLNVWMDTFGTGLLVQRGQCSDGGKRFTLTGSMYDPAQGRDAAMRTVNVIEGPDRFTSTMYMDGPQGEMKVMEIVYSRR